MKVSVCLVTYNHGPYIEQALESALAQKTDFPFEVIVGEDASTDGTREIVAEHARRFPSVIKPLLHPKNVGGPANFRATLAACTGQYVAFLDGDDYWTCSDKLQRQARLLDEHPELAICFHNVEQLRQGSSEGSPLLNPPEQKPITSVMDLLKENYIATASVMYRRELDRFLPAGLFEIVYLDWMLLLSHARFGQIGYLPEPMAVWRIHPGGLWSGGGRFERLEREVKFYRFAETVLGPEWSQEVRALLAETYFKLAKAAAKEGKSQVARAAAVSAARLNNRFLRGCLGLWLEVTVPGFHRFSKAI